ncbi:MAG: FlgO family outer membrane protein, partial [Giesbergeria sp.]
MKRLVHMAHRGVPALALALLAASSLTGCAGYYYGEKYGPALSLSQSTDLVGSSYAAADALLERAPLDAHAPVLVATLVNLDHLDQSSRFGRVVSEQIAGRLVQRGLPVPELRLRSSVALVPQEGQLLLSRELREVSSAHAAQAVVVGTYAVSGRQVY